MHLLLACVQKRNEHSTFQANPDGFTGSYICSPMQSNFSFAQKKKAPCRGDRGYCISSSSIAARFLRLLPGSVQTARQPPWPPKLGLSGIFGERVPALGYPLSTFLPAFLPNVISFNFPNSLLIEQSSHDIMHLLLTCVQKRNEHSTFQANPDGFTGSHICSPIQSNLIKEDCVC